MGNKRFFLTLMIGLLMLGMLLPAVPARADGLMLIGGVYRQPQMSKINATIKDKIATTVLEQKFRNDLDKDVSATYLAPVPDGATVTAFAELLDGQWVQASIKASETAKKEFDSAVLKGDDAAIASASTPVAPPANPQAPQFGFQTQVILPAHGERSVRLTYTQVLNGEVGLTRYNYPLSTSGLTDEKVGDLLIDLKIVENDEIRAVYSPSHADAVEVSRPDKNSAEVVYRAQNVVPAQNFEVIYTQSNAKFGVNMASYRDKADEDGFFVLVAAPQLEAKKDEVVQKDYVFVLDVSGSMKGSKAAQAKEALSKILDSLNSGDRFNVIIFSTQVTPYADKLVALDERPKAQQWVQDFRVDGSTNINEALLTAINTADLSEQGKTRPHIIVFLTDGQPTVGVTDIATIIQNAKQAMHGQTSLYTIGVGADVNLPLLDTLAQDNRGTSLQVTATDTLEKTLGKFHAAINNPVLVNLALNFGGMEVYDVYPNPIPDMFLGGQVVVTGRYKKGGPTTVTLTGSINGQPHTSTYQNIKFIENADDAVAYSFVSRLWAQRKVDALLRKLNVDGPDPKIVEQIRELGLKYNIITPYTSFVVTNPKDLPAAGLPFLYVDEYRTVNTGLIVVGACLALLGVVGLAVSRLTGRHA